MVKDSVSGKDRRIAWALETALFIMTIYTGIVQLLLSSYPVLIGIAEGYRVLVIIAFLYAVKDVIKFRLGVILCTLFCTFSLFLFEWVVYPENEFYLISVFVQFCTMPLPFFIYMNAMTTYDEFISVARKFLPWYSLHSLACIVMRLLLNNSQYSMSFGYYALFPACIGIYLYKKECSKLAFILGIINAACIALSGSRGPILCFGIYIGYLFFFYGKLTFSKMICLVTSVPLCVFFQDIVGVLYVFFLEVGINSRTLYLLANNLSHSSGRTEIYQQCWDLIIANPLIGTGVASDRAVHSYAHNLFLELWMDFGLVFGSFFLVVIALLILYALFRDNTNASFLVMFICIGIVPLMVSGSYLTSISFGLCMGVACRMAVKKVSKIR